MVISAFRLNLQDSRNAYSAPARDSDVTIRVTMVFFTAKWIVEKVSGLSLVSRPAVRNLISTKVSNDATSRIPIQVNHSLYMADAGFFNVSARGARALATISPQAGGKSRGYINPIPDTNTQIIDRSPLVVGAARTSR